MKKVIKSVLRKDKQLSQNLVSTQGFTAFYSRISEHICAAKKQVAHSINTEMVKTYWLMGKEIVEEEQRGQKRAGYGAQILTMLSIKLSQDFGKGFGVDLLENVRKFYLTYSFNRVVSKQKEKSDPLDRKFTPDFSVFLSWSHYVILMRIERLEARRFYEIEASKNHWSRRELARQVESLLFDRLAKTKNKKQLLQLANKGQEIITPQDVFKDPMVLEFLDLPESHCLTESKLEKALIDNLQKFLLELGKGFAFIGRQKRITLDGKHFYTDLVFYHVILKCYIIIDLKTHAITHADLGQMLFYVNYFDQEIKLHNDNPTVGLVLCSAKSDKMVKYTLGDKAKQIFASQYKLHLPTEKELETALKREISVMKKQ